MGFRNMGQRMMRLAKSHPGITVVFWIVVLTAAISAPLFRNQIIELSDGTCAFTKAVAMFQSWKSGDLAGRWTPDIIRGYGYPMFNYYSPMFFYFTSALMAIGLPVFFAFNAALIVMVFLSGLGMYFFAKQIWGRSGGLLSATAYLLAPYHIADLYIRGAVAEVSAFAVLPFIFWAVYRVMMTGSFGMMIIGMASAAGLILAHNITALLLYPVCFLYMVFLFIQNPPSDARRLGQGTLIFLGGVILTAYFWAPALFEKGFVSSARFVTGFYQYENHFFPFIKLLFSPWPKDSAAPHSYMIGPVHLALAMVTVVFLNRLSRRKEGAASQVFFFTLFLLGGVLMMLKVSVPVWRMIPLLAYVQFPTRFLLGVSLAVSVLAGGACVAVKQRWRRQACLVSVAMIITANIFFCRPFGYQRISFFSAKEYLTRALPMDTMGFLPRWVRMVRLPPPQEKLQVVFGEVQFSRGRMLPLERRYHVKAQTSAAFFYHVYYFPGWRVAVNGEATAVYPTHPQGLMMFSLPAGEHEVRIYFSDTPVRAAAQAVSLAGWAMLFVLTVFYFWRKPPHEIDGQQNRRTFL